LFVKLEQLELELELEQLEGKSVNDIADISNTSHWHQ